MLGRSVAVGLVLLVTACGRAQETQGQQRFSLQIIQHGTERVAVHGRVVLERAPFDLVLLFPEPMAVLVHAAFDSTTCQLARKGVAMDALPGFEATGMAEGLFNADHDVMLSPNSPNYWFYAAPDEHRFNDVQVSTDGGLRCTRTIARLFDAESGISIPIDQAEAPLQLVFIRRIPGGPEQHRVAVELRWASP